MEIGPQGDGMLKPPAHYGQQTHRCGFRENMMRSIRRWVRIGSGPLLQLDSTFSPRLRMDGLKPGCLKYLRILLAFMFLHNMIGALISFPSLFPSPKARRCKRYPDNGEGKSRREGFEAIDMHWNDGGFCNDSSWDCSYPNSYHFQKALYRTGMKIDDMKLIEINQALLPCRLYLRRY